MGKTFKHIILRAISSLIPIKKYRRALRHALENKNNEIIQEIQSRYPKIIERIRETSKTSRIKVAFLVSENQKWNCQSIYDEMASSDDFEPIILITAVFSHHIKDLGKYYTSIKENYEYFAEKGMNVQYAYNIETNEFLTLEQFKPDIIFYQQPWAIHPSQDIPVTSNFALSCYVPYGICVIDCPTDYDLDFFRMLWHQYSINEILYKHFQKQCLDLPNNYQIVGHPKLDTYLNTAPLSVKSSSPPLPASLNREPCVAALSSTPPQIFACVPYSENFSDIENYIIYAPHHSFAPSHLNFATFKWNGKFILEYAKTHPEFKFVFKPHPQLKTRLIVRKIMTEQEVENYFDEWKKIAVYCNDADYFEIFKKSKLMITDCSSFLAEYFPSTHPVINLKNKNSIKLNPFGKTITDTYYKVFNKKELETTLKMILEENNDPLKEIRLAKLKALNLLETPASTRILNLLRNKLEEKL